MSLPFNDALNNDDPISDELNLASLQTWYYALMLIGSNFYGIPLMIYGHKHAFYIISIATVIAVIFSIFYHTCQTLDICFGASLTVLTQADHISAPAFMMALILFIINERSTAQIRNDIKHRARLYNLNNVRSDLIHEERKRGNTLYPLTSTIKVLNRESVGVPRIPSHIGNNDNIKQDKRQFVDYLKGTHDNAKQKRFNATTDDHQYSYKPSSYRHYPKSIELKDGKERHHHHSEVVDITDRIQAEDLIHDGLSKWDTKKYERETYLTQEEIEEIEHEKMYYNLGYSQYEPNTLYDAWSVYALYTSVFIVAFAALIHPFSMQAFYIAITFGLMLIFFKIVIIDEGIPINMYHRIYLPDLLIGLILIIISLIFYMVDVYWQYAFTHSLWHILSFIGVYFLVIGLSRNVKGWYSPTYYLY